jgi:hypothetical protein
LRQETAYGQFEVQVAGSAFFEGEQLSVREEVLEGSRQI